LSLGSIGLIIRLNLQLTRLVGSLDESHFWMNILNSQLRELLRRPSDDCVLTALQGMWEREMILICSLENWLVCKPA
jgi:hypothetical protein